MKTKPNTKQWAEQIQSGIEHTLLAHTLHPKTPRDAVRFWDNTTPYAVHPIWCAMTVLCEPLLPQDVRIISYQALLWHDTVEDTNAPLPQDVDRRVIDLVEELTFASFEQETRDLWARSDLAKLLKLYDKVSNLLDATWMKPEKRGRYQSHTLRLADFVESRYGNLNIVPIARAICC